MKNIIIATLTGAIALVAANAAEIGKAAPAFSGKNVKGETVSLSDFAGKVVVLEWINLSCPFVRKHYDSGNMQKLQTSAAGKGVTWITISSSAEGKQGYCDPAKMTECIKTEGIKSAQVLLDHSGTIGKAYDAKVTPHMFIIQKDGTLAYDGAIDSKPGTDKADVATAEPFFADALEAVLAGKPVENAKNKPYGCGVKY